MRPAWVCLLAALALGLGACAQRALGGAAKAVEVRAAQAPTPQPSPVPTSLPQARPLDEARPLKVSSKRLRHDEKTKQTRFLGDVKVTQDSLTLTADELISDAATQGAVARGNVRLRDAVRKVDLSAGELRYANDLRQADLFGGTRLLTQDPYGVPVTITGQSGWYQALSQRARLEGGVQVWRGALSATAQSASMEGERRFILLEGGVAAALGLNQASSDSVRLGANGQSVEFMGEVRARFIPSQLRQAAQDPAGAR